MHSRIFASVLCVVLLSVLSPQRAHSTRIHIGPVATALQSLSSDIADAKAEAKAQQQSSASTAASVSPTSSSSTGSAGTTSTSQQPGGTTITVIDRGLAIPGSSQSVSSSSSGFSSSSSASLAALANAAIPCSPGKSCCFNRDSEENEICPFAGAVVCCDLGAFQKGPGWCCPAKTRCITEHKAKKGDPATAAWCGRTVSLFGLKPAARTTKIPPVSAAPPPAPTKQQSSSSASKSASKSESSKASAQSSQPTKMLNGCPIDDPLCKGLPLNNPPADVSSSASTPAVGVPKVRRHASVITLMDNSNKINKGDDDSDSQFKPGAGSKAPGMAAIEALLSEASEGGLAESKYERQLRALAESSELMNVGMSPTPNVNTLPHPQDESSGSESEASSASGSSGSESESESQSAAGSSSSSESESESGSSSSSSSSQSA